MPWCRLNLSSVAAKPQQPLDEGKHRCLPGCAGIQRRAVLLKQPLAEAGISAASLGKGDQGGKRKGRHDIKIRQIWTETENSFPASKLPQRDAQSTCDDK